MKKWKTVETSYLYKTPFGNLREDTCQLPNGLVIEGYHVNEFVDWVNAIVMTQNREIILVKQYRYGADDFFLEIPAGAPEEGELPEEAIVREVKEETGYISSKTPICLGSFFVNPATQNNKVTSYLIEDAYQAFEQELDSTEEIEVISIPIEEMDRKIEAGEITQLFSVQAYLLAKRKFI